MRRRRTAEPANRSRTDRGAALVEFGFVAPVMLMIVFAIFEFGLMFGQQLDVRNGSREGARLAAVNYQATEGSSGSTQTSEIVAEVCDRMELSENSTVTISFAGGTALGDTVTVEIRQLFTSVTGFFDAMLANTVLTSEVEIRLEQAATFAAVTKESCP